MATKAPGSSAIRLAGRELEHNHICAFFHSEEERDRLLMPFFAEGLARGEKVFHIVDSRHRDDHLSACAAYGLDTEQALERGQLEVRVWEEAYLQDGHFDGDRMVRFLTDVFEEARAEYGLTRLMGHMEWALQALPGVHDIVLYETKLNYVVPRFPDPVICVYDLNRHSGSVVMDILRTHPMVILGGVLQENPLFVPPDELLAELEQRAARDAASS